MASVNTNLSARPDSKSISRIVTLLGSLLVALSSGTHYIYSAYAPQLGARLRVSHTQLNIIGLAGHMGVSVTGPVWGRIVDRKGPRIPLIGASISLLVGYLGMKQMYDDGINGTTVSPLHFALLVVCGFVTGSGGNAGLAAAINTTAKSFPSSARATTTGLVLSGFGLSAFWFSLLAHTLFPGDISTLLLLLALGTAIPMLIGLFVVKPVPLHPTRSRATIEGYESIPSGDGVVLVGEAQVTLDSEGDAEAEAEADDSAPLLPREQERGPYQPPSVVGLGPSASFHRERSTGDKDELPDIHGKRLWVTPDFYLVCAILGICSGTGVMYINNVGSISQALYAKAHPVYDDVEASKWQAAQVSILSLGNFAGRVLIGLVSDFTHTRLGLPRAYCLCIVSSLFIISQATTIMVSSVETLWVATLLLGLAYGSLFGSCPTIVIEWFGLGKSAFLYTYNHQLTFPTPAHFSENWGYVSFAPILWGNLFSLMFGRYLDAHVPTQDARSSWMRLASRELPSAHQCFDGKTCYVGSLQVTLVACIASLGLSWWAGVRDGRKVKARRGRASVGG